MSCEVNRVDVKRWVRVKVKRILTLYVTGKPFAGTVHYSACVQKKRHVLPKLV